MTRKRKRKRKKGLSLCFSNETLTLQMPDLGVQVVLPLQHGVERGGPRHIEHHQSPHRLPVIDTSHVPIPLLSWDARDSHRTQAHAHVKTPFKSVTLNQLTARFVSDKYACVSVCLLYSGRHHVTDITSMGSLESQPGTRPTFLDQASNDREGRKHTLTGSSHHSQTSPYYQVVFITEA